MEQTKFISQLRNAIIEENLNIYKAIFENLKVEEITDEYWLKSKAFYDKINQQDKDLLYQIIRRVQVDTLSNVFEVLDGDTWLDSQNEDLELRFKVSNRVLNGDLQERFFELEEER